jgi:hypothetical protein
VDLGRGKVFPKFIKLSRGAFAFRTTPAVWRGPIALLDLHVVADLEPRNQEWENSGGQGIDLVHVIDGAEGEA